MPKIIGNPTLTPVLPADWNQTDEKKVDYIKNKPDVVTFADYATRDKAGVVKMKTAEDSGIKMSENGELELYPASAALIMMKGKVPRPITPENVDIVVRAGTNQEWKEEYTEAEKFLPMSTGVLIEKIGDFDTALDELHAYAEALVNGGAE